MDFTNLEDNSRETQLDYYEAAALLSFHNIRSGAPSAAPDEEASTPLEKSIHKQRDKLSEIYPGMDFEVIDRQIAARVKDGTSGSLVEHIGLVSPGVPHLATSVLFDSESIRVIYRADRIGIINDEGYYEFFDHDLDLEEVKRDYGDDKDSLDDALQEYFNEHVAGQMEDPYFDPWSEGRELDFETGSQGELDRLMKLFILTEPDIEAHEDEVACVYAEADGTDPHLVEDNHYYHSERLEKLSDVALQENHPVGWSYEYNDGAINRRSGYCESAESLTWEIFEILEQASAREKMAARHELRKWLHERGHDPAQFDALAKN